MKEDLRQQTIDTYDAAAGALSKYFQEIGPRTRDIERAFRLAGSPQNARILEIGCGNGRDAKDLAARADYYLGFDVSKGMVEQAQENVPGVPFVVADARTFDFPKNIDIIFAFASLLHLQQEEVAKVFNKAQLSLRPGGIFYVSCKYAAEYHEWVKEDKFGRRLFISYNPALIKTLAGADYEVLFEDIYEFNAADWFDMALKRR